MSRLVLAVTATALLLLPSSASARDYADTARNVVPSGQWGEVPVPPGADAQAKLYDSLTPRFDAVTAADLTTSFKSERFGVGPDGPAKAERVPRRGVRLVRDRYNVPHITGRKRDDVTWAMGWLLQEDRGLLLAQGRYPARLAAVDAPNVDAFGLVTGLKTVSPSRQINRIDPPQRPARAALRRPRRQAPAARHRRLRGRPQRAPAGGEEQRASPSRASTCSPPTRSSARSSARAAAARGGAGSSSARCARASAPALRRPCSTTSRSTATPTRRRRSRARSPSRRSRARRAATRSSTPAACAARPPPA